MRNDTSQRILEFYNFCISIFVISADFCGFIAFISAFISFTLVRSIKSSWLTQVKRVAEFGELNE